MTTEVLRVLDRNAIAKELARAGRILKEGGLVAFPTETVYGIAVAATIPAAVDRLYRIKGRPRSKPMTMMVADTAPVFERCPDIPPTARALMKRFWPGPLTLVLKDRDGHLTGFRLPSHPLARGVTREAFVPLLVPSANPADLPPATTADQVLRYFPRELDLVIDAGPAEGGVSSTVVQVVRNEAGGEELEILREGAIPEWRIREPGQATILFVCRGNTDRSPLAAALLKAHLARRLSCDERDLESRGFRVLSAGVASQEGKRASPHARRVAKEWPEGPLDVDGHLSRKLTTEMLNDASRVFCMEREQREQILAFFPHREADVFLVDPEGGDVEDPAGSPVLEYRKLLRRLDAAASLIAASLVGSGS
jgi:tRNA threonylcarbamoyl adenosine modification protein (Sua5/YciO/YrdC/YwlC family)